MILILLWFLVCSYQTRKPILLHIFDHNCMIPTQGPPGGCGGRGHLANGHQVGDNYVEHTRWHAARDADMKAMQCMHKST